MKIPEPVRLWWHDGPGVRVIQFSARQWTVYALVCAAAVSTTLIHSENPLSRGLRAAVPLLLIPAGLFALCCAIAAVILTRRFRRAQR